MNRLLIIIIYFCLVLLIALQSKNSSFAQTSPKKTKTNTSLSKIILSDQKMDSIQNSGLKLLRGFSAGTSYAEIWIRDFNTFIEGSIKATSSSQVREKLLMFFKIQGEDGNIVDGLVADSSANVGYAYRRSALLPGWAAHKNTVETDQESSLIQAVTKYVHMSGDRSILDEKIAGKTVLKRMEDALLYIRKERWAPKYALVKGATTIDWGDVQPEKGWGVAINKKTKWAVDIYDNAMYKIALDNFNSLVPANFKPEQNWNRVARELKSNVRRYLWDVKNQKYRPHLYLNGSPFSKTFNENKVLYSGGSICAILAGFNSRSEVIAINNQLLAASAKEKHATIGMTVYPPYPLKEFPNMHAYTYQNAGDWTWFGARMTGALLEYGMTREAYAELQPMIERTLANKGFFEWYDVQTGEPKGSGSFRGEAGVLYEAISQLKEWAKKQQKKE